MKTQQKNKIPLFSSETSRVKLIIYLKNSESKTFYSLKNDDNRGIEHSIKAMHRRLLLKHFKTKFNCAIFYDNIKGHELMRFNFSGCRILPN